MLTDFAEIWWLVYNVTSQCWCRILLKSVVVCQSYGNVYSVIVFFVDTDTVYVRDIFYRVLTMEDCSPVILSSPVMQSTMLCTCSVCWVRAYALNCLCLLWRISVSCCRHVLEVSVLTLPPLTPSSSLTATGTHRTTFRLRLALTALDRRTRSSLSSSSSLSWEYLWL